jgi:hypothetical protein
MNCQNKYVYVSNKSVDATFAYKLFEFKKFITHKLSIKIKLCLHH